MTTPHGLRAHGDPGLVGALQRDLGDVPQDSRRWFEAGRTLASASRWHEAVAAFDSALALSPSNPAIGCELAVALANAGDYAASRDLLEELVARLPGDGPLYLQLGSVNFASGRLHDAIRCWSAAANILPSPADALENLAAAWRRLGDREAEAECWRRLAAVAPTHPVAAHMLGATGRAPAPERASDGYVQHLFDRFARDFDHVLARLSYRVPALARACFEERWPEPRADLRVLDVGCGTGLCGAQIKPWTIVLDGVDLSPEMLAKARALGVYSSLATDEMCAYLSARPDAYDVIVAGDVLCYTGDLAAFARASRRALRPGGRVVFSVEATESDLGFVLEPHGRYSHAQHAIRRWFSAFGELHIRPEIIRTELGAPVHGWWVVAENRDPVAD